MPPKTNKQVNKKTETTSVADNHDIEIETDNHISPDTLREWFNFFIELDVSKLLNKNMNAKEDYDVEFRKIHKIYIDTTSLIRCLNNKRQNLIDLIVQTQQEYREKYEPNNNIIDDDEEDKCKEEEIVSVVDKNNANDDEDVDDVPVVEVKTKTTKNKLSEQEVNKTTELVNKSTEPVNKSTEPVIEEVHSEPTKKTKTKKHTENVIVEEPETKSTKTSNPVAEEVTTVKKTKKQTTKVTDATNVTPETKTVEPVVTQPTTAKKSKTTKK
jgi:hypothetical protein